MQFKLLNFHRVLANFSTSLIGGFSPLIIYSIYGELWHSIAYLVLLNVLILLFNIVLKKQYIKRPQIMLLCRIVTMSVVVVSLMFISEYFWIALSVLTVSQALDLSIKLNAPDFVLNYVKRAKGKTTVGSVAIYRVCQNLGVIIAYIMGGLILDRLSTNVLAIAGISIYMISVIPLTIFYFMFKKTEGFNTELVTNASVTLSESEAGQSSLKKLIKKILLQYGAVYFIFGSMDMLGTIFNLYTFIEVGTYSFAAYLSAAVTVVRIIGTSLTSFLNKKIDMTIPAVVSLILSGLCVLPLPFIVIWLGIEYMWLVCLLYLITGFLYEFYYIFVLERLMTRTRVLGFSNQGVALRQSASNIGKIYVMGVGLVSTLMAPILWPMFVCVGVGLISAGILVPENEEGVRKNMIEYLEGREIK